MADPMTYYTVATKVAGFIEQRNQAAIQEQIYRQNRIAAVQARDLKIQQLQSQAAQQAELYSQKKLETAIQALKAREAIINRATYGGNNLNLREIDVEAQKLRADTAYNAQNELIQDKIYLQSLGFESEALNRISKAKRGQEPSIGFTALDIAASAYASERKFGKDTPAENVTPISPVPPLVMETN